MFTGGNETNCIRLEANAIIIGEFGVHWVLSHAIELVPGGIGGPIQIATLRKDGSKWVAQELPDLQQHEQYISRLEKHIGEFLKQDIEGAASQPPPPPPPPNGP